MEDRWVRRNVNLSLLNKRLASFFEGKGFKTASEKSVEGHKIVATPKRAPNIQENVTILITGDSEDFTIKFITGSHSRSLIRFGFFTSLLGGGSFLLRGLASQEALERLEKEFWNHVDEIIDRLAGSAGSHHT